MLHTIDLWISAHPYIFSGILLILFTNAVAAMPTPVDADSKLYKWAWTFLHSINIPKLIATFNPQAAQSMKLMPIDPPQTTPLKLGDTK